MRLADPSYLSAVLLRYQTTGIDNTEIQIYPDKIRAVTLEDTQAVIDELIQPERLVIVTVGP